MAGGDTGQRRAVRRSDRAVFHRHPPSCPRRSARTPGPHPLAERAARCWLGSRRAGGLPERARHLLARRLRLACVGGAAQCAPAVHHDHRRRQDPLSARAVSRTGCLAADSHPRLARLGRRVPGGDRSPHRSGGARRRPRRRFPPGGAVDAGVRVFGSDPRDRVGHDAHRPGLGRTHAPARLRPVRRAGGPTGGRRFRAPWASGTQSM